MGKKTVAAIAVITVVIIAALVYIYWPIIDDTLNGEKVSYNYEYEKSVDFIIPSTIIPDLPEEGKTFVIVKITEKNTDLDSYTPKVNDVKVKGSDGNIYGAHLQYSVDYDSSNASLRTLGKGESITFKAVYEMPKGVSVVGSEWNATWPKGVRDGSL